MDRASPSNRRMEPVAGSIGQSNGAGPVARGGTVGTDTRHRFERSVCRRPRVTRRAAPTWDREPDGSDRTSSSVPTRCGTDEPGRNVGRSVALEAEACQNQSVSVEFEQQGEFLARRRQLAETMRSFRLGSGMTQPELVDRAGKGLSVNAYKKYEWVDGQQLPDQERLTQIVEALGEGAGVLVPLWEQAKEAHSVWKQALRPSGEIKLPAEPRFEPWVGYTFRDLFQRSVEAVVATCTLAESEQGKVVGWRHFLENEKLPVTPVASSYGVRILLMANHAGSVPSIGQIRQSILDLEHEGGGWSARTQNRLARVEVYGPVLHALRLAGLADEELMERVEHLEEILDPEFDQAAWQHTTVLTSACNTLSNVHPESYRIRQLVETLAEAIVIGPDGEASWTQSVDPARAKLLSPSIVHTSRVICTLDQAPDDVVADLMPLAKQAVRWLERQQSYRDYSEIIDREGVDGTGADYLNMRHFTAAWVARALAVGSMWTDVNPASLRAAEDTVLRAVGPDGLWRWDSGEQPIWMTFQGLRALREVSLAEHDLVRSLS